jgi:hypothetical protein
VSDTENLFLQKCEGKYLKGQFCRSGKNSNGSREMTTANGNKRTNGKEQITV